MHAWTITPIVRLTPPLACPPESARRSPDIDESQTAVGASLGAARR